MARPSPAPESSLSWRWTLVLRPSPLYARRRRTKPVESSLMLSSLLLAGLPGICLTSFRTYVLRFDMPFMPQCNSFPRHDSVGLSLLYLVCVRDIRDRSFATCYLQF